MTTNHQQLVSPEMRPENERAITLKLAVNEILSSLEKDIEKHQVNQASNAERPFVLKAIDLSTTNTQNAVRDEQVTTVVTFPSSIQHNLIIEAVSLVDQAYEEAA